MPYLVYYMYLVAALVLMTLQCSSTCTQRPHVNDPSHDWDMYDCFGWFYCEWSGLFIISGYISDYLLWSDCFTVWLWFTGRSAVFFTLGCSTKSAVSLANLPISLLYLLFQCVCYTTYERCSCISKLYCNQVPQSTYIAIVRVFNEHPRM